MKAFGKILGLVLLGLLLIIVALGFALTHLFDPNDYKDEIRQIARDKAHIELTLNGDIGWSLFPWLGLELHEASVATLTNPTQPFADLQMLGLSVRVLPLLRREVQMSDVRVEGLNLRLNRDKQGHGNWEDIGKVPSHRRATPPAATPANRPAKPPSTEKPAQPIRLDIDSLTVNNARVEYNDEQTGKQFSAESIQLSAGAVHEGASIPVKAHRILRQQPAGDARQDRTQRQSAHSSAPSSATSSKTCSYQRRSHGRTAARQDRDLLHPRPVAGGPGGQHRRMDQPETLGQPTARLGRAEGQ